jgi:hypothetical protein
VGVGRVLVGFGACFFEVCIGVCFAVENERDKEDGLVRREVLEIRLLNIQVSKTLRVMGKSSCLFFWIFFGFFFSRILE